MELNKLSVSLLTLLAASSAYAGAPKGKPFVQLENQIVEVQGQLEQTIEQQVEQLTTTVMTADTALEERVTSLEGRTLSLEDRVATAVTNLSLLNTKATNQQNQISDLINTAAAHGVNISALQDELATVNQQIVTLETQTGDHASEIAALQAQAASLTNQIEANAAGLTVLEAELADTNTLIVALQAQLSHLQIALETKQDIINRRCPDGQALVGVQGDGSIVCAPIGAQGITVQTVFHATYIQPGQLFLLSCPAGTALASGSFHTLEGGMNISRTLGGNTWYYHATNAGGSFHLFLQCIALVQ